MKKKDETSEKEISLKTSFLAGAVAGLVVDISLFPLDTLKTRLQSQHGFWKSGGFKRIYKGVGPTAVGSAPCAALFFSSYNTFKFTVQPYVASNEEFIVQMAAAALGELVSCVARVPTEIVKQRRQACLGDGTSMALIRTILKTEGLRGMYHGFWTTVLRDAPFSVIQFPLWEFFKKQFRIAGGNNDIKPIEGAICGSLSGAIAGAVTTPLDVVKTRIMLSDTKCERSEIRVGFIVAQIYKENGTLGFFAGFLPRVVWIFLGGGVFFGVYEKACHVFS